MRWIGREHRAVFRVTSTDDGPVSFDALLILGRHRHVTTRQLRGERTPFELALPNTDLTAIVRPQHIKQHVVVEYTLMAGPRRVLYGRGWSPVPVLQRRGHWILVAGLGDASDTRGGPSAASLAPA